MVSSVERLHVFLQVYDIHFLHRFSGVSQHCNCSALLRISPSLFFTVTFQELQATERRKDETVEAGAVLRFQEFLGYSSQLNGVALWGTWPFLIRAGDNNELVCPELITDSRLFSFPIHKDQVIVNRQ